MAGGVELLLPRMMDAVLEGVQYLVLAQALDRDDEGKAEAGLVAGVEIGEAGEFRLCQAVEAGAGLFLAAVLGEFAGNGQPAIWRRSRPALVILAKRQEV